MQMTVCKGFAICIWAFMFVIHWNLSNRSTGLKENACANLGKGETALKGCPKILRGWKDCITEGRKTDAFWVEHKTIAFPVNNHLGRIKTLAPDVELELLFQSSPCSEFIWVIITVQSNVIIMFVCFSVVLHPSKKCPYLYIQWLCSTELTIVFKCLKENPLRDSSRSVLLMLLF